MKIHSLTIEPEYLKHIADLDAFQASWDARHSLTPERLNALRRVATIESIGSSTRIEGSNLSDAEVVEVLGRLEQESFATRDEQEVAGYADAMDTIFTNYQEIPFTENYLKQLHKILLNYSEKDTRHRGRYKTLDNHVEAFNSAGKSLGVVFKTATPFDTPREMEALVRWTRETLDDKGLHPLLTFFLRALVAQKKHLESKLSASQGWEALPLDSIAILNYLTTHDRITVSEVEALT